MLATARRYLDIMKAVAVVTYKEWAAYRTHSMISIFVGPVYYLVQLFIWQAVYSSHTNINGMSLENMLTYYAVTALIGYFIMDFADWNLQMLIHTGRYISFALRPVNHMFFAFSQKVGHRFLGLLFEFLPVLCIFIFVFRVPLLPSSAGWAALSVCLGFIMNFAVNYCIGLSGFWLVKTDGIRGVYQLFRNVFSGALVPLSFFPESLQNIMFFLPFQHMSYTPAMVFIGSYELGGVSVSPAVIVAVQAAYTLLMLILARVLYSRGNKRFTGVGA